MALTATTYSVELHVADVDRGHYDTVPLTLACHPSETPEFLVARTLAFALEHAEGLAFSKGLCAGDEPALWRHDLTGALQAWVEVGTPAPDRLHRAAKAAADVAVYCHKEPTAWLRTLAAARVHRAETIRLYALDRRLVGDLAARLERRNVLTVTRSEGGLFVELGGAGFEGAVDLLPWPT